MKLQGSVIDIYRLSASVETGLEGKLQLVLTFWANLPDSSEDEAKRVMATQTIPSEAIVGANGTVSVPIETVPSAGFHVFRDAVPIVELYSGSVVEGVAKFQISGQNVKVSVSERIVLPEDRGSLELEEFIYECSFRTVLTCSH
jgi:hypothetical protein